MEHGNTKTQREKDTDMSGFSAHVNMGQSEVYSGTYAPPNQLCIY